MIPLYWFLILSAVLFSIGIYTVITRRNTITILMGVELMLNIANINLIAFSKYTSLATETGQVFALFVMAIAATAAAVGLAIVLALYRVRKTVYTDEVNLLKW